jgi:hypothetical protein
MGITSTRWRLNSSIPPKAPKAKAVLAQRVGGVGIILPSALFYIGWMVYIFGLIAVELETIYFYNLISIYMLTLLIVVNWIIFNKFVNRMLRCSIVLNASYVLLSNISFYIAMSTTVKIVAVTTISLISITLLTSLNYDRRRNQNKR